uniref:Uncharacterized protein n=1 Tax=Cannabis sativa TaxID=3483 RepID=A0A803P5A4_CANSA
MLPQDAAQCLTRVWNEGRLPSKLGICSLPCAGIFGRRRISWGGQNLAPAGSNWKVYHLKRMEWDEDKGDPRTDVEAEQPIADNRMVPLYERFRKQAPPVVLGGLDMMKAEEWLTVIERILNFIGVVGNDRVTCATFKF